MATEDKDEPFRFPCAYPLKVVGRNTNEFYSVVTPSSRSTPQAAAR